MVIPQYLVNISKIIKQSKSSLALKLYCQCGKSKFTFFKNKPIEADKNAKDQWEKLINGRFDSGNVEQYSDQEGNIFIIKKNLFGKVIDKENLNNMPRYSETNIMKIVCEHCGKEHIVFDNRIHGYDAFTENKKEYSYDNIEFVQKKYKDSIDNLLEIEIKIHNDLSLEEFRDQISRDVTIEEYSNAFSNITIYGNVINLNHKRVTVFSEETA